MGEGDGGAGGTVRSRPAEGGVGGILDRADIGVLRGMFGIACGCFCRQKVRREIRTV